MIKCPHLRDIEKGSYHNLNEVFQGVEATDEMALKTGDSQKAATMDRTVTIQFFIE